MILIYGSHGYMGSAIAKECEARGLEWHAGDRNKIKDEVYGAYENKGMVINAAAFIPPGTVDQCKNNVGATLDGNVMFPALLRDECSRYNIPLMHLSTGCLFNEEREYTESDTPTRGWDGYCGFYVGTKLMSEKLVSQYYRHWTLRLRLPFDEVDHPRNYLTKLIKFDTVFEHVNSLTHRGDFAKWALDLWQHDAPYGTYHCVNKGQVSAAWLVSQMRLAGMITKAPNFQKTKDTSGALLCTSKLESHVKEVRTVVDAVQDSIKNWKQSHV